MLGMLAALVGPKLFGKLGKSKLQTAKTQISMLGQALDTFRLDVGRYPDTSEGLEALREQPAGLDSWEGPYLNREVPEDPWKNEYVYTSPGSHGEYDLVSYGADGSPGGEGENQDIVSWRNLEK
ncbi:MAG: type II secretion system major pseudopilin GspG [bacterium]